MKAHARVRWNIWPALPYPKLRGSNDYPHYLASSLYSRRLDLRGNHSLGNPVTHKGGRPPLIPGGMKKKLVSLQPDTISMGKALGGSNLSLGIRRAVTIAYASVLKPEETQGIAFTSEANSDRSEKSTEN